MPFKLDLRPSTAKRFQSPGCSLQEKCVARVILENNNYKPAKKDDQQQVFSTARKANKRRNKEKKFTDVVPSYSMKPREVDWIPASPIELESPSSLLLTEEKNFEKETMSSSTPKRKLRECVENALRLYYSPIGYHREHQMSPSWHKNSEAEEEENHPHPSHDRQNSAGITSSKKKFLQVAGAVGSVSSKKDHHYQGTPEAEAEGNNHLILSSPSGEVSPMEYHDVLNSTLHEIVQRSRRMVHRRWNRGIVSLPQQLEEEKTKKLGVVPQKVLKSKMYLASFVHHEKNGENGKTVTAAATKSEDQTNWANFLTEAEEVERRQMEEKEARVFDVLGCSATEEYHTIFVHQYLCLLSHREVIQQFQVSSEETTEREQLHRALILLEEKQAIEVLMSYHTSRCWRIQEAQQISEREFLENRVQLGEAERLERCQICQAEEELQGNLSNVISIFEIVCKRTLAETTKSRDRELLAANELHDRNEVMEDESLVRNVLLQKEMKSRAEISVDNPLLSYKLDLEKLTVWFLMNLSVVCCSEKCFHVAEELAKNQLQFINIPQALLVQRVSRLCAVCKPKVVEIVVAGRKFLRSILFLQQKFQWKKKWKKMREECATTTLKLLQKIEKPPNSARQAPATRKPVGVRNHRAKSVERNAMPIFASSKCAQMGESILCDVMLELLRKRILDAEDKFANYQINQLDAKTSSLSTPCSEDLNRHDLDGSNKLFSGEISGKLGSSNCCLNVSSCQMLRTPEVDTLEEDENRYDLPWNKSEPTSSTTMSSARFQMEWREDPMLLVAPKPPKFKEFIRHNVKYTYYMCPACRGVAKKYLSEMKDFYTRMKFRPTGSKQMHHQNAMEKKSKFV